MSIKGIERFSMNNLVGIENDSNSVSAKEQAEREARRLAEIEYRNEIVEENREKLAREQKATAEKVFLQKARLDFFEGNPNAKESDFQRLLPKIRDEFYLENFRQRRAETACPEWFNAEFQ